MELGFRRGFTTAEKTELWDRWQRGKSLKAIGRAFGNPTAKPYLWSVGLGGRSGRTDQGACWSPARRH